ncbi:MAG: class I SAM-dependent DNA methyltransferase [Rhodospirillales bacterium]
MARDFFKEVYGGGGGGGGGEKQHDPRNFYAAWAETYDADVEAKGYVSPARCAAALAAFAPDKSAPVADFGCGTGLSGLALRAAGFSVIDGYDISDVMLEKARARGCYRRTAAADLADPGAAAGETYAHAAVTGVIVPDYFDYPAPVDLALSRIAPGGCVVINLNDKALAVPAFPGHIEKLAERGEIEVLFHEYGAHLPELGVGAAVYVMRKRTP